MAFREMPMFVIREVLRLWLAGRAYGRSPARSRQVRVDRKTVRRYVAGAEAAELVRGGEDQLTDELISKVRETSVLPGQTATARRQMRWCRTRS